MNIIKDKQITTNNWIHIADTALPASGDITLALNRWKDEKSSIALYDGKIGIRLAPSDSIEDIANDLKDLALIALEFTVFTDGRSFSQARILRDKYQYAGEIRAIGSYMPDQAYYLHRVGVNAFESDTEELLSLTLSTLNDFTVNYQTSSITYPN